ncbi:glutathione-disulfide reductase [Oscillatoria sp. FACHB-1407]|uniref:glutathione-disulfide reductase n=1 Tax=Oscillatoria sp. FACHB-1407 TaxID=2692847 RepID=UPI001684939E|nr:glutathione-disulfide reductase [Oscillatoria sp. FACHB-1407]MBD2459865.1 glutathione-disulfide reductase [Oscillatoria sp. FACHB-1407]
MPFDFDLLVIGAGSGGLAAAERAATYGAKVAIAEHAKPGGACVNYGCIPEKLLDFAASFKRLNQVATSYGWQASESTFDWSHFVAAKEHHIEHLNELHAKHLKDAGVQFIHGHAHFLDAHTVEVDNTVVTAEKVLIAVGAKPSKPDIPGVEHSITWHELYRLPTLPRSLAIFGGDPIGVKISGSMNALGCHVTQIIAEDRILSALDGEIAEVIQETLTQQGVKLVTQTRVKQIEKNGDGYHLELAGDTSSFASLEVDAVLMDAPRQPNLDNLTLSKAGIQLTASGAIRVDEFSRTSHTNIFAIGDCTERIPLTPSAIAQGRAFADTEFGVHPQKASLSYVPISLASHPEAATVGQSEAEARGRFGEAVHCYRSRFRPLLYCLMGGEERTFVKVVVNTQDSDRVLGIHMVGTGAVEIIQSLAVALRLGLTKSDLDRAIGIHPSSGEEIFSL